MILKMNIKKSLLASLIVINVTILTISYIAHADDIEIPHNDGHGAIVYGGDVSGGGGTHDSGDERSSNSSNNNNYVAPPPNTCQWSNSPDCTIDTNNLPSNCGLYNEGDNSGVICATDPDEVKRMTTGGREWHDDNEQPGLEPINMGDIYKRIHEIFHPDAPNISFMPDQSPNDPMLVKLPVWLWVNPNDSNYRDFHGNTDVKERKLTVSAHVVNTSYKMGDGNTINCTTAGTPYDETHGANPSPDCGYTYQHSGTYNVETTFIWKIDYDINGKPGTSFYLIPAPKANHTLEIHQQESVNR